MAHIIKLTRFSGDDGAKQLADLNIRRCDSVIYCKTLAEAMCYREMIDSFSDCHKGVDHLQGIIAICLDPTSTAIDGMHLISKKIPDYIKSSYPFQFRAKTIGENNLNAFLEECGLKTEKELKGVWERCARRLSFPIEAIGDEKTAYLDMFVSANNIIQEKTKVKIDENIEQINQADKDITRWFSDKFGKNKYGETGGLSYHFKSWKVMHHIIGYKPYYFSVEMLFSEAKGVDSLFIEYSGLHTAFSLSWPQNDDSSLILGKVDNIFEQFAIIMEAISKAHKEARW